MNKSPNHPRRAPNGSYPEVYVDLLECPDCGKHEGIEKQWGRRPQGDGSYCKYARCKCGCAFKVVEEPRNSME